MKGPPITVHWFRRDLRLEDNHGLYRALLDHGNVLPLFIFDEAILEKLEDKSDRRVDFIHRTLQDLKLRLEERGSSMLVRHGTPEQVWSELLQEYDITAVTANHDHEPYAIGRDERIAGLLKAKNIPFRTFKDISIFERGEVLKDDGDPYTVFTPYARKWKLQFKPEMAHPFPSEEHLDRLWTGAPWSMPGLEDIGFATTDLRIPPRTVTEALLRGYQRTRDIPGTDGTSRMSVHLRFGTVSVRALVTKALEISPTYLNELIWREFFMQILWHFPQTERAFKPNYDRIEWRNAPDDFRRWCEGRTGYPLVDAGMRELLATGHMHNRVRMVVASFLCKHLLLDWRLGEAWFARKLLDFELSSNNGGWQWASGSGCDAAPYFRVFNPHLQLQKFDPQLIYVKRWVPEHGTANYVQPMVVHEMARTRALSTYKAGLAGATAGNDRQTALFD